MNISVGNIIILYLFVFLVVEDRLIAIHYWQFPNLLNMENEKKNTIPRMGSMLFSTWMISGSSKQRSTWRTISTPRMFPKNWFPINMNDHLRMMNGYPIHFLHWLLWQGLQYRWIAFVPLQSFWIDWFLLISSNDHLELRWVQIKDTYRKQTIETKE